MGYTLENLLRLREFREESAARDVNVKRQQLTQAIEALAAKKKEVADYIDWRLAKEEALFQKIARQQMSLKDLDEFKQRILLLRQDQETLESEAETLAGQKDTAQAQLDQAKQVWTDAVKNKSKIEAHKKTWVEQAAKQMQLFQEKEMEDFHTPNRFENEEDDHENTEYAF